MQFLREDDPRREVWEQCESPIEQYLCCGLFTFLGCKGVSGLFRVSRVPELVKLAGQNPACFLFAQHWIGRYRADFLAVVVDPESGTHEQLVIECDGKKYHGSDEQKLHDEWRARDIEGAGYRLIRYSGSDIYGDMREVLKQIKYGLERCGVVCEPAPDLGGYALVLSTFTPDRSVRRERQEAREAYWQEQTEEYEWPF